MKKLSRFILVCLFALLADKGFATSSGALSKPTPKNNDSTINIKSNIMIFKMITAPAPNSGALKKAGKVARTSNSHSLSLTHASPSRSLS